MQIVVGGDKGTLRVYALTGKKLQTLDGDGNCLSIVCSSSGNIVLGAFGNGIVRIFFEMGSEKASDLSTQFTHEGKIL